MIQLDRHSFGLQPEISYNSVNRRALGYMGLFTIHNDGQLKYSLVTSFAFRVSSFEFRIKRGRILRTERETRNAKRETIFSGSANQVFQLASTVT